jgi:hypothetical protein
VDPAAAKQLALNAVVGGIAARLDVVPVDALPRPAYGFDPSGWCLFAAVDQSTCQVGASQYVAVNPATGEVKLLGKLGE